MQMIRSFFKRILDDLKQKKLLPLKILCFVHASTHVVLYPYLTIHMRELGISVEETAVMSSLTPLFLIMIPPLAGLFADKIGNFRLLLALTSVLGGLSALLMLTVPVGRLMVTYPPSVELVASCNGQNLRLQHVSQYSCQPLHQYAHETNLTVESCGYICELPNASPEEMDAVLRSNLYNVNLQSPIQSTRLYYQNIYNSLSRDSKPVKDQTRVRILTNDPYFNSTMRKVTDNKIFFPVPQLYKMECKYEVTNATCTLGKSDLLSQTDAGAEYEFRARLSHDVKTGNNEVHEYKVRSILKENGTKYGDDFNGVDSTTCIDKLSQTENVDDLSVWVQVNSKRFSKCYSACAATAPRTSLCENSQEQVEIDPALTFWTYMAVRVFVGIIGGTSFAMFEGAVIAIIREQCADYGLQKVYGSFGGILSSPLSGLLIDYASRGKGYRDFRPAFYLYAVLKVLCGALMLSLDLEFKKPAKTLVKDVITVFKSFEILALLIACVVMGTAWGYLESFLFWFLQDLGASQSLMGITITVGGVAGLPLLVLSGPIISKIGHSNVLFIGFVFYAIRLFGYSLIYNPWLSLIFEAMESVTLSLSFTAAVTYAALLSSTTTDTSVQGLLGGLYYGVGKGAGSLSGGYLMKYFGTRTTYRLFAGATLVTGCIYFLFNRFCIRKFVKDRENNACKKANMLDVEGVETIRGQKVNTDVAKDASKLNEMSNLDRLKLVTDSTDGGSDSGVENPAYTEHEGSAAENVKREESKEKV
ncbi:major facilitator superfamily domain-containing protein 6-A-like [Colias croceus]|uniref:major facilitator superfamily domain-containing protein 6-A-like n=1 Tax=Colias crocea TaxID=72248 RepID=UPI001E27BFBA|nr:major facilitator superfamily domain-containing protein 6-A-like [Colias croceus]